jgi:exodeoxyribonuclease V gamma subunit
VDLRADLPGGTVVTGTVGGVRGDTAVRTVYSRLGAKHRLRAWVQLLALTTAYPDRPWRAVTVGRASGRQPSALVSIFTTPDVHRAGQWLEDLVRLRERALREPLPMPVSAAYEYAVQRSGGADPDQALERAAEVWDGGFERRDEYHRFCWGDVPLSALPGGSGVIDAVEQAWWPQERTRFGVLARRVWDVPLRHEEVTRA